MIHRTLFVNAAKKLPDGGLRARYRVRPRLPTFLPIARNGTKVSSDTRNALVGQIDHSRGRSSPRSNCPN